MTPRSRGVLVGLLLAASAGYAGAWGQFAAQRAAASVQTGGGLPPDIQQAVEAQPSLAPYSNLRLSLLSTHTSRLGTQDYVIEAVGDDANGGRSITYFVVGATPHDGLLVRPAGGLVQVER